jgi:transposase
MLTVNDYARIRGAHRDGMTIGEIAREFHHSRRKVRAVLKGDGQPKRYSRQRQHYRKLGDYLATIDEILAADEHEPPKQRHTAMRIFERLKEQQYQGGYDAVRRYVAKRQKRQRETFIPLSHDPGQRVEADFGQIYVDFPDGRRAVSVLILVWSYSNYPFAMALPTQRTEAILEGMTRGFDHFGHVPREVWWDNPKTVALDILIGRERRLQSGYAALASHYVFDPLFCMPASGNEKPYVENRVKTLQRRWSTPVPKVKDFDELNAYLLECCLAERERTRHGTKHTIGELFARDCEAANPLPQHTFDPCVTQPAKVDKYQLARFDNVCYSVPRAYAFETVTMKGYTDRVDVVHGDRLVASHPRSYESGDQVLDPLHYLASLGRRPAALDHSNVYRRWKLPAVFAELPERLEQRHGSRPGVRQYIRVLQLLAKHTVDQVQYVIERLRGDEELDAQSIIRRVTERAARDVKTSTTELDGQRPEVAQVSVPDPDLTMYDRFLSHGRNCDEQEDHDGRSEPASAEDEPEAVASADDVGGIREAGSGSGRVEPTVRGVSPASDGDGSVEAIGQRTCVAHSPGVVSGGKGPGQLRFLGVEVDQQAEDLGAFTLRVDCGSFQHMFCRRARNRQDAYCGGLGPGRLPQGLQDSLLHGRVAGESFGGGAEAIPVGPPAEPTGPDGPVDLRRAGLPLVQPHGRGVVVSGLRRSLRAEEPVDHEQPPVWRLGPDLSGRADDGGVAGSVDASLRDISDERRKLPIPGVDEEEGQRETQVTSDQSPPHPPAIH